MSIPNKLSLIYKVKSILKTKNLKKTKQTVMFLRSPKHFKRGKQFLSLYTSYIVKSMSFTNIATFNIVFLSSKSLYNLFYFLYLKSCLPEQNLKKITIKFNIKIKF